MAIIRSLSGIRGKIEETMVPLEAYKAALAFYYQYLKWQRKPKKFLKVVLGKDARQSGDALLKGIIAALGYVSGKEKFGLKIIYLGITSSPIIQWTIKNYEAQGGINITASHNDISWNGFKLVSSHDNLATLLDREQMQKVNKQLSQYDEALSADEKDFIKNEIDKVRVPCADKEILKEYHQAAMRKIKEMIDLCCGKPGRGEEIVAKIGGQNYRVVVDACSGQGAEIVEACLLSSGLDKENIVIINNGTLENSQRRLEPAPPYLENLMQAIKENKADLGFAVDPDQDRLVIMPLKSEEATPLLAAKFLLELQKDNEKKCIKKIAINLSSSSAWEEVARAYGVEIERTPIGEINVAQAMLKEDLPFGAEGNGGIILGTINYGRNSTVGIMLILAYLAWKQASLKDLENGLPSYLLIKEKIKVPSEAQANLMLEKIERFYQSYQGKPEVAAIDRQDGYKVFFKDNSWLHLRPSNTEPFWRVFAEAKVDVDERRAEERIKELINEANEVFSL